MIAALYPVVCAAVVAGAGAAAVYAIVATVADAPRVRDVLTVLFKED